MSWRNSEGYSDPTAGQALANGYLVKVFNTSYAEEAGLKSVTFEA